MRTTVTLDEDVAAALKRLSRERGVSFKEALNTSVRRGLAAEPVATRPFRVRTRAMGLRPGYDYAKALELAAGLEDDEIVRELAQGK